MASSLDLQVVLATITQGLVEELDVAFARIWLLGPGDLCAGCYKAADCVFPASAGMNRGIAGPDDRPGSVPRERGDEPCPVRSLSP